MVTTLEIEGSVSIKHSNAARCLLLPKPGWQAWYSNISGDYTLLNTSAATSKWSCYAAVKHPVAMIWYLVTMRDAYSSWVYGRSSNGAGRGVWSHLHLSRPIESAARPSKRPSVAWHVASLGYSTYDTQEKRVDRSKFAIDTTFLFHTHVIHINLKQ